MSDLLFLVVKEILKQLRLLSLVVPLAHEAVSSADFVVTEDGSSHDLPKHELVSLVPDLVVDLSESEPG